MMDWAGGSVWMGLGPIFMIVVWALVILGVVALVRWLGTGTGDRGEAERKTPVEILQERYARGEIKREEYEQKRRDLEA